jgi:hypothetical protein
MNYIGTNPRQGKALQVVNTKFQGEYSTTSGSWADVSGFAVTITPSATNNKIKVEAVLQMGGDNWQGVNIVREVSGSSDVIINQGTDTVGSKQNSTFGSANYQQDSSEGYTMYENMTRALSLVYLDSPATTLAVTYQIQVVARYGTTDGTVYINRPHVWNDDSISGRVTSSNIIVSEVEA